MKIAITGAHFSPSLALIDKYRQRDEFLFIGRKYGLEGDSAISLEYKICEEKGIRFAPINAGRIQRSFTIHTIPSLLKMPKSFKQARSILKDFKPDVVVGFGGYVSFPVVLAAYFLRIPVVIHEQTLEAGAASKKESIFAKKICISFESSFRFFPKNKTVLTGNPIRSEIIDPKSDIALPSENLPMIYITGGSLGSVFINTLVGKDLKTLLSKYRIIHQVGLANNSKSLIELKEIKKTLGNDLRSRYLLSDHFSPNEVGEIMRKSSLIIGRSGINTICELLYLNKPALLIPLPFSQRGEQLKNANFLRDEGLAEVLDQEKISNDDFLSAIDKMISGINKYSAKKDRKYLFEEACENIMKVIEDATKKQNQEAL